MCECEREALPSFLPPRWHANESEIFSFRIQIQIQILRDLITADRDEWM